MLTMLNMPLVLFKIDSKDADHAEHAIGLI